MKNTTRRQFLRGTITAGALAAFGGLTARLDRFNAFGERAFANDLSPYGPLGPVASVNTGETLLSLPAGFQYNVLGRTGSAMTNGAPTPKLHDGMAAFSLPSRPDSWVLVRNHEVADINGTSGIVTGTPSYDAAAGGGTTTVVVDKQTRLITESFASLAGTVRNCAGGRTPWNTWISCEETNVGTSNGFGKPHGYCFEVTPLQPSTPVALKAMGRFRHEAVAVELLTGIVYLTEDNDPAGFYRFLPAKYGQLSLGGRLQMLAVSGRANADLRTGQTSGQRMIVEWVDIGDPDPAAAETDLTAVFSQGAGSGGATFRRLEGCFAGRGSISFTSTTGGNAGFGQVWRYDSRVKSRFGHLTLVFESPDAAVLDLPDNICPGPRDSIVLCEDGSNGNYVRLLSRAGSIADLAQNITPGFEASEFAGSTFSPDGRTLFVNIQTPGITLAIWGAW